MLIFQIYLIRKYSIKSLFLLIDFPSGVIKMLNFKRKARYQENNPSRT